MTTLAESVYGTVVQYLMKNRSNLMFQFTPSELDEIISEEVSWLCDDWPEDQGFGSSDSYGTIQAVIRILESRLEQGA